MSRNACLQIQRLWRTDRWDDCWWFVSLRTGQIINQSTSATLVRLLLSLLRPPFYYHAHTPVMTRIQYSFLGSFRLLYCIPFAFPGIYLIYQIWLICQVCGGLSVRLFVFCLSIYCIWLYTYLDNNHYPPKDVIPFDRLYRPYSVIVTGW